MDSTTASPTHILAICELSWRLCAYVMVMLALIELTNTSDGHEFGFNEAEDTYRLSLNYIA